VERTKKAPEGSVSNRPFNTGAREGGPKIGKRLKKKRGGPAELKKQQQLRGKKRD